MRKISGRDADIPMEIRLIVPMAGWIERHPRLSNWLIVIGLLAMVWVVFTYDFTIPAYRNP